jgi:hypothetical protein
VPKTEIASHDVKARHMGGLDTLDPLSLLADGDEEAWLRFFIRRLRITLRFAKDPLVIAGLQELIIEAENRLTDLHGVAHIRRRSMLVG